MTALLPPHRGTFSAALDGDPDALDALLRQHRAAVEAVCFRRLRSRLDAEDAVQETMVRGMRSLEHIEDPTRLKSYLCRIAERVCLDMLRAGATAMPTLVPEDLHTEDPEDDPEAVALDRERTRLVHQTLQALSERQATALWMRDALGEPVPAVAERLGVTEGSARVLLTRARAKMRDGWKRVAALLPGAGFKLPSLAAKIITIGPLAIPAILPVVFVAVAVAASPVAIRAIAIDSHDRARTIDADTIVKGGSDVTTIVLPTSGSSGTSTDVTTARPGSATTGSQSRVTGPETRVGVGVGDGGVAITSRDSTAPDDDVTVGNDDLLQVGAEGLLELLDGPPPVVTTAD